MSYSVELLWQQNKAKAQCGNVVLDQHPKQRLCNGNQDFYKGPQGYCPPVFDKGVKVIIGKWQSLQQIILKKMAYPSAEE